MKKQLLLALMTITAMGSAQAKIGLIGLKDFNFGNEVNPTDQKIQQTQKLCVYGLPTSSYTIRLTTTGKDQQQFTLHGEAHVLPVTIEWNGTALTPNKDFTFHTGSTATEQETNCENVTLTYKVNQTATIKTAGQYLENINFEITSKA